jgi:hypothetical protein
MKRRLFGSCVSASIAVIASSRCNSCVERRSAERSRVTSRARPSQPPPSIDTEWKRAMRTRGRLRSTSKGSLLLPPSPRPTSWRNESGSSHADASSCRTSPSGPPTIAFVSTPKISPSLRPAHRHFPSASKTISPSSAASRTAARVDSIMGRRYQSRGRRGRCARALPLLSRESTGRWECWKPLGRRAAARDAVRLRRENSVRSPSFFATSW